MIEVTNPTEFRKKMKEKLDKVSKDKQHLIIHRLRNEDVVVMPVSEYNSWQETHYLLSTEANRKRLQESVKEVQEGKTRRLDVGDLWK